MEVMVLGLILVLAILIVYVTSYNKIIRAETEAHNAFSQIDVQLKRRYDLIPNLVETVKGYAAHEKNTLEAVIKARSAAASALSKYENGESNINQVLASNGALDGLLSKLMMLSEAYPDLKADTQFNALSDELSSTENRISYARQAFNDAVMIFNQTIQTIPANIVAGMMGRHTMTHLEVIEAEEERNPVKASF